MLSFSNGCRRYWSTHLKKRNLYWNYCHAGKSAWCSAQSSQLQHLLVCTAHLQVQVIDGVLWRGFGTLLSQGKTLHLDVCCLLDTSLVCKGWLYWPPNGYLYLYTQSSWPAAAICCSAGPSSGNLNSSPVLWWGSVCDSSPISALYGNLCEGKSPVESTRGSCCADRWHLTLAFCCFLHPSSGASHLASNQPVS